MQIKQILHELDIADEIQPHDINQSLFEQILNSDLSEEKKIRASDLFKAVM